MNDYDRIPNYRYDYMDNLSEIDIKMFIKNTNSIYLNRKELDNSRKKINMELLGKRKKEPVTLNLAIKRYNILYEGRTPPLSENDPKQIKHWNSQVKKPCMKTILLVNDTISTNYNGMLTLGRTLENLENTQNETNSYFSETFSGSLQKNNIESAAIVSFVKWLDIINPSVSLQYDFLTVYDGLYADLMVRKKTWPINYYKMLQFKSSIVESGKKLYMI